MHLTTVGCAVRTRQLQPARKPSQKSRFVGANIFMYANAIKQMRIGIEIIPAARRGHCTRIVLPSKLQRCIIEVTVGVAKQFYRFVGRLFNFSLLLATI